MTVEFDRGSRMAAVQVTGLDGAAAHTHACVIARTSHCSPCRQKPSTIANARHRNEGWGMGADDDSAGLVWSLLRVYELAWSCGASLGGVALVMVKVNKQQNVWPAVITVCLLLALQITGTTGQAPAYMVHISSTGSVHAWAPQVRARPPSLESTACVLRRCGLPQTVRLVRTFPPLPRF